MNYGAEPADQVVRYTLEGTEFALKISGTAAKNFAVFALAVLRDQKKTHGKTKLVRLLREGKPLKFFSVPTDQMRDFAKAAKSHGLLYVPIRDRSDPDNIEIAVWAEDAAKAAEHLGHAVGVHHERTGRLRSDPLRRQSCAVHEQLPDRHQALPPDDDQII